MGITSPQECPIGMKYYYRDFRSTGDGITGLGIYNVGMSLGVTADGLRAISGNYTHYAYLCDDSTICNYTQTFTTTLKFKVRFHRDGRQFAPGIVIHDDSLGINVFALWYDGLSMTVYHLDTNNTNYTYFIAEADTWYRFELEFTPTGNFNFKAIKVSDELEVWSRSGTISFSCNGGRLALFLGKHRYGGGVSVNGYLDLEYIYLVQETGLPDSCIGSISAGFTATPTIGSAPLNVKLTDTSEIV